MIVYYLHVHKGFRTKLKFYFLNIDCEQMMCQLVTNNPSNLLLALMLFTKYYYNQK